MAASVSLSYTGALTVIETLDQALVPDAADAKHHANVQYHADGKQYTDEFQHRYAHALPHTILDDDTDANADRHANSAPPSKYCDDHRRRRAYVLADFDRRD